MTSTPHLALKAILFILFTVSGFSGLIYESVWSHYLKLILGHAAYAQTIVLAIFMGGMAFGAWLSSHYLRRWTNPLLIYAIVEGIVGGFALVFHELFVTLLDVLYQQLIPSLSGPATVAAVKWGLSGLLILPQSILLGMTFPLMSAGIIRLFPHASGATLGMLYFTNSIGAAVGVLVSAFVLIPWIGLPGTILTAGVLNVLLAVGVWALAKGRATAPPIPTKTAGRGHLPLIGLILSATLFSGMASFFYEIGWIRMLSLVLGSTTQAFEMMLSAFITGLALGGLWIRWRIAYIQHPLHYVAYIQLLMGLFALLTLPLYNSTFDLMGFLINSLAKSEEGYTLFNLGSHALALAVMLPATVMAGMTLPLFTHVLIKDRGEQYIGQVYAANTVGAIIGVLLAVHLIMPTLGTKGLVLLGGALDMVLGLSLLLYCRDQVRRWELPVGVPVTVLAVALVGFGVQFDVYRQASGVYRHGKSTLGTDYEILFHQDGKTSTIDLFRTSNGTVIISTNGKPDASIAPPELPPAGDEITMIMAAALPLALNPQAQRVANIGMGSGLTSHTLLKHSQLQRLDTVEIEQAMVEAAQGFGKSVENAYLDSRSHIYIEDAKTFFSNNSSRYDIIVSEPSNPWVSGVASLFSEEFYRYIRNHLNKNGLLVQWLQLYEIDIDQIASVFKALNAHFDHYVVFSTDSANILIIASNNPIANEPDKEIFENTELKQSLARIGIHETADLEIRRLGSQSILWPLFKFWPVPPNSDYFPLLSHQAPKSRFLKKNALSLLNLHYAPVPALEILDNQSPLHPEHVVTESRFLPLTEAWQRANALANAIQNNHYHDQRLSSEQQYWLLNLDLVLNICQQKNLPEERARLALLFLAESVNPFLSAIQLEALWQKIAQSPCTLNWSPEMIQWLALHQASARRDGAAMLAAAQLLLAAEGHLEQQETVHLAVAGLVGALAVNDRVEIVHWRRLLQSKAADAYGTPPLYLTLLDSLAVRFYE